MKKATLILMACTLIFTGCATVQSIIKSTFPYTSTLIIPASSSVNNVLSATSPASSFDQIFGNQNGANYIKEVRVASAKLEASNPSDQNLGAFKSVQLFLVNGNGSEVMVASRSDISADAGNSIVLDINASRFVDDYIKGNNLRIRMEYTLRNKLTTDISVRAAINFNSAPNTQ